MVTRYKITVLEIDGVELAYPAELDLNADNMFFDNTDTELTFDNVGDGLRSLEDLTFESITEAETAFEADEEVTTSNNWVTAFTGQSTIKDGGSYIVLHSSAIGQSQTNKQMQYRVQYRLNALGNWSDFIELTYEGRGDAYILQTGLGDLIIPMGSFVEIRFQFGQTDSGGSALIKNKGFLIWKIED